MHAGNVAVLTEHEQITYEVSGDEVLHPDPSVTSRMRRG